VNANMLAMQLNAVRASLIAALEQCDAMRAVLAATPEAPPATPPQSELKAGERLFTTFGGAKVPPPQSSAGDKSNGIEE